MGNFRNWIGVTCFCVWACGGVSERSGTDETGGASSAGSTHHTGQAGSTTRTGEAGSATRSGEAGFTTQGGSTSLAGNPAVTEGTGPVLGTAGAPLTMPTPSHMDSGVACFNDTDCPGMACGEEVCNWNKIAPTATPNKPYYCNAAGTDAKTMDGWCTSDADCKCRAFGAKCVGVHCSFTRAADAPRP